MHADGMPGIARRVWNAGALGSDAEGAGEEFLSANWGRFSQIGGAGGAQSDNPRHRPRHRPLAASSPQGYARHSDCRKGRSDVETRRPVRAGIFATSFDVPVSLFQARVVGRSAGSIRRVALVRTVCTGMARNPREFLRFILDNLQPLLEISQERRRFSSVQDVEIPFRRLMEEGSHVHKRIDDMISLGILIPAAGDWVMPAYVRDFLQRLQEQHAASAPGVVKAIVSQLQETTEGLADVLDQPDLPDSATKAERALKQACELFYDAVDRLEQTCLAIESEVAKYRAARDSREVKASLRHLLELFEQYLMPLVDIIDLNGLFVMTSNRLLACCERILGDIAWPSTVTEQARISLDAVLWQRHRTLKNAAAVRYELEPLYQIALRDSQIFRGLNRLHTLFSTSDQTLAGILSLARIEDSRDVRFLCNESIRNEFRRMQGYVPPLPPLLTPTVPTTGQLQPQFRDLREDLLAEAFVPDLMDWFSERCGRADADYVLKCLSHLYFDSGRYMAGLDAEKEYEFDLVTIQAHVWEWRMPDGK